MNDFQYRLDPSSKKHLCPSCGERKFVRFIDRQTGYNLPLEYGRCDREDNCGYFKIPKDMLRRSFSNKTLIQQPINGRVNAMSHKSYIPGSILDQTCIDWQESSFVKNLMERIPYPVSFNNIRKVSALYRVGSVKNGYRKGAVTFPYIDNKDNVHAIQVKQFDNANHTTATDALHSIIEKYYRQKNTDLPKWLKNYLKNEKKFTCLFGEHLLKNYPTNPIALVEAPKTAIIASLYFGLPDNQKNFLWLAVYNKSSLNAKRAWPLKGRKVVLFPDIAAYHEWEQKSGNIGSIISSIDIKTSDFLETRATELEKRLGLDLADYLIKYDWRGFQQDLPLSPISEKGEKGESEKENYYFSGEDESACKDPKAYNQNNTLPSISNRIELLQIAKESIGLKNHSHRNIIPYFDKMLELKIIEGALPLNDFYFITGSSPF
jgi:hypothetical protein